MSEDMQQYLVGLLNKDLVPELCKSRGFEVIDAPAERHGSWQCTLYKRADELDRFVSVAFTSLPKAIPDATWYHVEVWAGAEGDGRYTRKPISDFRASGHKDHSEYLRSALTEPLMRAMSVAESFKPADLTEAYPLSRSRR